VSYGARPVGNTLHRRAECPPRVRQCNSWRRSICDDSDSVRRG